MACFCENAITAAYPLLSALQLSSPSPSLHFSEIGTLTLKEGNRIMDFLIANTLHHIHMNVFLRGLQNG